MIWLKSFGFGILMFFGVALVGSMISSFTMPYDVSNAELFVDALTNILLVWYCIAGALLLVHIKQIKVGLRPFLIRSIFIWGPINIGWYMLVHTGIMSWFMAGTFVSSILLCYEVLVLRTRK